MTKSSKQIGRIIYRRLPPTNKTGEYKKNPAEKEEMNAAVVLDPVMRQYRQAGK